MKKIAPKRPKRPRRPHPPRRPAPPKRTAKMQCVCGKVYTKPSYFARHKLICKSVSKIKGTNGGA